MTSFTDQHYLREHQYGNAANLHARIALHERFSTNPGSFHRWLFDQLVLHDGAQILEVGCGSCEFWGRNLERIPESWAITLTDFSVGMLDEARHALGERASRFGFALADAQELPFPPESFDAVVANFMLYHVPDRRKAYGEFLRVLRPGGRLYAATNGSAHMVELSDMVRDVSGQRLWKVSSPFTLETGLSEVQAYFREVTLLHYPDGLAVTDAEPLVAYIISTPAGSQLNEGQLRALKADVENTIATAGAVHITKDPGLLVAVKP